MESLSFLGVTLMVVVTTADDAIWLARYTSPSLPTCTRIVHGALFVFTLEFLACGCVAVASGLDWAVSSTQGYRGISSKHTIWENGDVILGSIGAGMCWVIALTLYVRVWLKRRRRPDLHRAPTEKVSNREYGSINDLEGGRKHDVSSLEREEHLEEKGVPSQPSPCTVISLTMLGALDEVSYFPSLLLGKIFTPVELCLGTLFAACIVLVLVTLFISQCKPLLDWLEQIPLYGIVSAFAMVLTAGVIVDIISIND